MRDLGAVQERIRRAVRDDAQWEFFERQERRRLWVEELEEANDPDAAMVRRCLQNHPECDLCESASGSEV